MKQYKIIYEKGDHKWGMVARDPERPNYLIDTNEYLIIKGEDAILTDPGGVEVFPEVFTALSNHFNPHKIKYLFASHQDPDIISSLSFWLEVNEEIKCYISWIWKTFIPHYGGKEDTFILIPDIGMKFKLGSLELRTIPAHYLHSSGNHNLYDERAKILFSGDIGAALMPIEESTGLFVKDFDNHIRYMDGFHRRWMSSNEAKLTWCENVSKLKIDMLCPQHGSIFTGENIKRFIDWFSQLPVGGANFKI